MKQLLYKIVYEIVMQILADLIDDGKLNASDFQKKAEKFPK